MKRILIILFCILFTVESVWAMNSTEFAAVTKNMGKDFVSITYKGEELNRMSKAQFEALIKSAEFYDKMIDAEKNKKVSCVLKDDPWSIKVGTTFKSSMDIIWWNQDGTILKKVTVDIQLGIDKKGQAFLIYSELTIYLFPAVLLVAIVLALILIFK